MKSFLDRTLATASALTLALATSALAYNGPGGAQLGAGAAGQNLGTNQVSPTAAPYNAKCDVVYNGSAHTITSGTNDSTAFQNAINNSLVVALLPGQFCEVGDLTLADHHILDCNGSYLFAAAGSKKIITLSGVSPQLRHCKIVVPVGMAQMSVSSTLASAASPGATSVTLASAAGWQTNLIMSLQLACGTAHWTSRVTGVSGNVVSFVDPVPYCASAVSVPGGGAGWTNNEQVVISGGVGMDATGHVTASGGVMSAIALDVRGLWSVPPAGCDVYDPINPIPVLNVCTLTFAGANSGAVAVATFGAVYLDQTTNPQIEDVDFVEGPGLQVVNSTLSASQAQNGTVRHIRCEAASIFCLWKSVGVSGYEFHDIEGFGYANGSSAFGANGFRIDSVGWDGTSAPSGGNVYSDIKMLGFELGVACMAGTLDSYNNVIGDTNGAAGLLFFGCNANSMGSLTGTFNGAGGTGHGAVFAPYGVYKTIDMPIGLLFTKSNLCDLDLSYAANAIAVQPPSLAWAPSKIACGDGRAVYAKEPIIQMSTGNVVGTQGRIYAGPSAVSVGDVTPVVVPQSRAGAVLDVTLASDTAPGSHTITVTLYDYPAYNYGAPYQMGKCTFTGSQFGCEITEAGMPYNPGDWIVLSIADSTGVFPSMKLRAVVSGL